MAGVAHRRGELRARRAGAGAPRPRTRQAGRGLVHHSDRGSKHLSIRHTERLGEAGVAPSAGGVGDPCGNALAETVIGQFKTGGIRRQGPWRSHEGVETARLESVDWFNHCRKLS